MVYPPGKETNLRAVLEISEQELLISGCYRIED